MKLVSSSIILLNIIGGFAFQQSESGKIGLAIDSSSTIIPIRSYDTKDGLTSEECVNSDSNENCGNHNLGYNVESSNLINQNPGPSYDLETSDVLSKSGKLDAESQTSQDETHKDDGSLRQVLFIHRHGDRTPIQFPPKDNIANESFWSFNGYGQLTNRGKSRLYLMGKTMRERYGKFLRGSVNKNIRVSRASGSLRCIESAQVFLSSFLALDSNYTTDAEQLIWGKNSLAYLWQPASIQSVPAEMDGMLAESSKCNLLMNEYDHVIELSPSVQELYTTYRHEKEVLEEEYGFMVDHFYKWFWASSQIEVEKSYFKSKMNPKILSIYNRLQEAGEIALTAYQSTLTSKRLRGGLLIGDMLKNMESYKSEYTKYLEGSGDISSTKAFIHYSAHDLNLVILLGIFDQWHAHAFRPDYASNMAIELHYDKEDKLWFVKFKYMPHVPGPTKELKLAQCIGSDPKSRCSLERFESMMQPFVIQDWQSWMKECQNDLTKLDPYSKGS